MAVSSAAMGLKAGQHQPEGPGIRLGRVRGERAARPCVDVERLRSEALEQGCEMGAREGLVTSMARFSAPIHAVCP